jgi:glycopeptide antibiotics resistance protein
MKVIILLYIGLIILLNIIPLDGAALNTTKFGPFRLDYLLHTALFLPWMFLFYIKPDSGWKIQFRRHTPLPFLGWLVLGLLLALGSEGIQYWVHYRGFNPMDAMFNALGVIVGAGVFIIVQRSAFNVQRLKKE